MCSEVYLGRGSGICRRNLGGIEWTWMRTSLTSLVGIEVDNDKNKRVRMGN